MNRGNVSFTSAVATPSGAWWWCVNLLEVTAAV